MTLNLGLRWDVQTPGTDPQNRFTTYVPGQKSTVKPDAPAGQLFYGDPGVERGVIPTAWNHVSPRVGIVWDPFGDGKTSIRAAAGIFYGSISGNEWNTMTNFQPWSTRLTFTNINARTNAAGVPLGASLSNPYNDYVGRRAVPLQRLVRRRRRHLRRVAGLRVGARLPDQRRRSSARSAGRWRSARPTSARSTANLPFGRDVNYPVVTPTATDGRREHPGAPAQPGVRRGAAARLGSVLGLQRPAGHRSSMRPWHHVSFNGFYTLSKTMTSAQLQNNTTQGLAQNYSNLARGLRPRRHRPAPRVQHERELGDRLLQGRQRACCARILNGWTISPIVKLRSGLPFTVTNGNVDANLDGNTNDRAQQIGDPHLDNPTPAQWFNTAAFVQNKVVTGVAGRRQLAAQPARRARATASSTWRSRATSGCPEGQADVPRRGAPTCSTS